MSGQPATSNRQMLFRERMPRMTRVLNTVAVGAICWTIGVALVIRFLGDRWWIGTMAMFAPRWLLALPILTALAAWPSLKPGLRWVALFASLVGCWGILGFCIPLRGWFAHPPKTYRVLTCNVASWASEPARLNQLILVSDADIVLLQEFGHHDGFSLPDSWHSHQDGELLIASRYPLNNTSNVQRKLPGRWPRAVGLVAEVMAPERVIQITNVHLLSPRYGLSKLLDSSTLLAPSRRQLLIEETSKRKSESLRVAQALAGRAEAMIVGGDFNMPEESSFFRQHWSDFDVAFSQVGFGVGNTCFVWKRGIPFGARIDHLLTRGAWKALRCWVGPDVGSDHRPVLADVYWP